MKARITTYLFVSLYLVAMLRPIAPLVDYVVNYDYISKVLCINKEKPELHCNGKCHVAKELEGESQTLPSLPVVIKEYPIGFVDILSVSSKKPFIKTSEIIFSRQKEYAYLAYFLVFHPPRV